MCKSTSVAAAKADNEGAGSCTDQLHGTQEKRAAHGPFCIAHARQKQEGRIHASEATFPGGCVMYAGRRQQLWQRQRMGSWRRCWPAMRACVKTWPPPSRPAWSAARVLLPLSCLPCCIGECSHGLLCMHGCACPACSVALVNACILNRPYPFASALLALLHW